MAILNVANMGKFSSDHTVSQYAEQIWAAKPVPQSGESDDPRLQT
jgi:starch phosphorylase